MRESVTTFSVGYVAVESPSLPAIIEQLNRLNQQINFLQSHLQSVLTSVNKLSPVDDTKRPCSVGDPSAKGVKDPDTVTFRLQDIESRLYDLVSTSELISNHLSKLV